MKPCEKCHQAPVEPRLLLEVQTLHIRGFTGEQRVQALGNFVEANVCRDCARRYLAARGSPRSRLLRSAALAALLAAVGTALLVFLLAEGSRFPLFGGAAILCAAAILWSAIRTYRTQRAAQAVRSEEENLAEAAWALLVSCLPKKAEDSDLTYLPITEDFPDRSVQDLVRSYDLLPAIAKKARELAAQRLGRAGGAEENAERSESDHARD